MQFFLFIAVVILIVFGVITIQNPDMDVAVKFIKWNFSGPLAAVLAVPFAVGIVASMFIFIPPWMKKASLARHQKKRIHELELELANAHEPVESEELIEEEAKSEETSAEEEVHQK